MFKCKSMWAACAISAAFMVSCSQEELAVSGVEAPAGTEIVTTVGISAKEAMGTRALPDVFGNAGGKDYYGWSGESGKPSVGNIDLGVNRLTYTIGIYTKKTDGSYMLVGETQSKQEQANDEAYFNFRLIKGQSYRLVAYADYGSVAKSDLTDIDLTADRGGDATKSKAPYILNDELNDAFFVSKDFVASEHVSAILKRPFGKLRLIAHDFDIFSAGEVLQVDGMEVTFKEKDMLPTDKFNALTGEFVKSDDVEAAESYKFTSKPVAYLEEYDENGNAKYAAVFTIYLPANVGEEDKTGNYSPVETGTAVPQSWMYPFDITVKYKNRNDMTEGADNDAITKTFTRKFDIDIPVKRNWLTTVDAEYFWTDNSNIKVSIDSRFDGFMKVEPDAIYVKTEQELNDAIQKIKATAPYSGRIVINNDIDIESKDGVRVFNSSPDRVLKVTIDLNGHTVKQVNPSGECVFEVRAQSSQVSSVLILEDTSKEATGTVTCDKACFKAQTLYAIFGGQLIVNGGNYYNNGDNAVVYAYDEADYDFIPSKITINGGYFKNYDAMTLHGIAYGGDSFYYYGVVNVYNSSSPLLSGVEIKGGSFLDYNPAWGDNMSSDSWVPAGYTVLESTVTDSESYTVKTDGNNAVWPLERTEYTGTHTLYTVISKDNPNYY